jgi:hypothetical protein
MAGPLPTTETFSREYGCTEREWLSWMPSATGGLPRHAAAAGHLRVSLATGHLDLTWTVLEPRRIALIRLPRMAVSFAFEGVPLEQRLAFLKRFDQHLQRGGG